MKRLLRLVALAVAELVGMLAPAQVAVTPISQPHQTFVDNSGSPCAFCKLYSYAAGTTTPQPTYTDSTGVSQNTNPIVLDIAGGANIWTASSLSYKFSLLDSNGNPLWTVDNVKAGGGGLPCTTPYAIQYANGAANALTCDPSITINPSSHAIEVGGPITGPFFSLRNLGTIAQSWTFDVTSPTTAAASLSPISLADLALLNSDSVMMNATGGSAAPASVAMPTGCTLGVNYSTSTHSWTCSLTAVPLASLAVQAADTVVMNATAGSAAPTAVAMPTGCTSAVNYDTTAHAWTCASATAMTLNNVAGSRLFGVVYQNTSGAPILVQGYGQITGGSGDSLIACSEGTTNALGLNVWATTASFTVPGETVGFYCPVPVNYYYEVTVANHISSTPVNWFEAVL